MWVLDPANSPVLIDRLRRYSPDLDVVWVGEGWRDLVTECHEVLERSYPAYALLAIKQTWGELAFQAYPRPGDGSWTADEYGALRAVTDPFAARSRTVCEWCGRVGRLREWRTHELTLCDDCEARFPDPPFVPTA